MLLVKGRTLLGKFWSKANIIVSDSGRIVRIFKSDGTKRFFMSKVDKIYNAGDKLILPGLIDCHVHFRDPGETYKEDFESGSKCAVASGVVVVGDMPNTIPRVDSLDVYLEKRRVAERKSYVDFFLYVAPREDGLARELVSLPEKPRAVKIYLPKLEDFNAISRRDMPREILYVFHAEHPKYLSSGSPKNLDDLDKVRPPRAELEGIKEAVKFASRGYRVHITHVSTAEGMREILNARRMGIHITCDITPHHLIFYRERVEKSSSLLKVLPPIRSKRHRDFLIGALTSGQVDAIASDHAPHGAEKLKDFPEAPYGIQSIQYLLPLIFSLCTKIHVDFRGIIRRLSINPARIFGIKERGWIKVGNYADLVVFDPHKRWVIDPDFSYSKTRVSPYDGMYVRGYVEATFIRGRLVYENGTFLKRLGMHI